MHPWNVRKRISAKPDTDIITFLPIEELHNHINVEKFKLLLLVELFIVSVQLMRVSAKIPLFSQSPKAFAENVGFLLLFLAISAEIANWLLHPIKKKDSGESIGKTCWQRGYRRNFEVLFSLAYRKVSARIATQTMRFLQEKGDCVRTQKRLKSVVCVHKHWYKSTKEPFLDESLLFLLTQTQKPHNFASSNRKNSERNDEFCLAETKWDTKQEGVKQTASEQQAKARQT